MIGIGCVDYGEVEFLAAKPRVLLLVEAPEHMRLGEWLDERPREAQAQRIGEAGEPLRRVGSTPRAQFNDAIGERGDRECQRRHTWKLHPQRGPLTISACCVTRHDGRDCAGATTLRVTFGACPTETRRANDGRRAPVHVILDNVSAHNAHTQSSLTYAHNRGSDRDPDLQVSMLTWEDSMARSSKLLPFTFSSAL
ncbi:hypothetical protein GCM10023195_64480 [Actinoallomurus liliacearum]|uniref:Tc1-like transposase DDE domain-containing protein n=1 Tax=Actinoallomurus liliacearum TaxID=1080073 RepID=A0ABP8TRW2_9ACTN